MKQRLISKIEINNETGCWEWTATTHGSGYGLFYIGNKTFRAHRISWQLENGTIPDGMFVCHSCDNPSCINPEHLFLGSPKDNSQDMVDKGRQYKPTGTKNKSAKLTDSDVIKIRSLFGQISQNKIADLFDVNPSCISKIKHGHLWSHVR